MIKKRLVLMTIALLFAAVAVTPQTNPEKEDQKPSEKRVLLAKLETEKEESSENTETAKKVLSGVKYRLLEDNGFFVDGAFTQEQGYVQHTYKFARSFDGSWQSVVEVEMPLESDRHGISFIIPGSGFRSDETGKVRGFGDLEIEYRYRLLGGESSKVTISPTFGVALPTGSYKRELGSGGFGTEISLPLSIAFSERFMTHSKVGVSFTPTARNLQGDRAQLTNYEIGQSFVWFAHPKFNALVEMVWERNKEVIGPKLTKAENELFVSPGFRWGHTFSNGLMIVPGFAVPIGVGPNKAANGLFFYLSIEQPFKKRRD